MLGTPDRHLFDRLLAESECEWIEFKDSWFDPGGIGRYASALANSARLAGTRSGYLVWGVKNDGSVVGTKLDFRTRVVQNQPFEFWLKGRLAPRGHSFRFYQGEKDGKRLIALIVLAADRVPVRFEQIAYIRVGSATPPLHDHPDREERLLASLAATTFEDDPAREHATVEEIFELIDVEGALERLAQPTGGSAAEMLRRLETLSLLQPTGGEHWTISNVAAVLFARKLESFGLEYARKAPRVVIYTGDSRVRTLREQTGTRGYAVAFDGLAGFLDRHLPRSEQLKGYTRIDHPIYPMVALRELVANALIHQDFSVRGAGPLVEVFDERIEITNPGTPLVDVDRLIDEPPRSRNERLAFLMRQIGYCEERGSGIDKVVQAAEMFQLPPPNFAVKQTGFVGTLYAPRAFADMTTDERVRATYQHSCLLYVSGATAMTNATLRQRFGLADNRAGQISRLIGEAVDKGMIRPANPGSQSRAHAAYLPYWA